jgi:hypothetical protein
VATTCKECGHRIAGDPHEQKVLRSYRVPVKLDVKHEKLSRELGYSKQDVIEACLRYMIKRPQILSNILAKLRRTSE